MKTKKRKHWAKFQKRKTAKKIKFNRIIVFKVLLAIFLGVTVYSFIFSSFLEVTEIKIDGLEKLNHEEVKTEAIKLISGKYLGVIPKNNILLIIKSKFGNKLREKFKKIEMIKVNKKFPNKLNIIMKERKLALVLCSRGNCFFVDRDGHTYMSVDFESEDVQQNKLIRLIDESGKSIKEGDKVLRPDFVQFLFEISDHIREYSGVEITGEYRSKSLISEEVIVQTVKGWDIYLSSNFSIEKSSRVLRTILNKQINLREANNLEYIDLRSENKVFYRMRGAGAVGDSEIVQDVESNKDAESSLSPN